MAFQIDMAKRKKIEKALLVVTAAVFLPLIGPTMLSWIQKSVFGLPLTWAHVVGIIAAYLAYLSFNGKL